MNGHVTARRWLLGVGVTLSLTACAGAGAPAVSDARAREVALAHVDGTVERIEREQQGDRPIVEVVLRRSDGELAAVEVDGRTGDFIRVEAEEDDDGQVDEAPAAD